MWYLINNTYGIAETGNSKKEIMLNHEIAERESVISGKMCYHVIDESNDYYLFSSKEQAIAAGFSWAFENIDDEDNEINVPITSFRGKYNFLSNFYNSSVSYNGLNYLNAEAAYQAQKSLDLNERIKFINLNASEAKRLGKKVNLRPDWKFVKLDIMKQIVYNKFKKNTVLRAKLIATGDSELIEGNYWGDRYWGKVKDKNSDKFVGENHLGIILMEIRANLRQVDMRRNEL